MDRQTDGQTDRFAISISRVGMQTHDKNYAVGMMKLTTDKHEASCGLSATAELLVKNAVCIGFDQRRFSYRLRYTSLFHLVGRILSVVCVNASFQIILRLVRRLASEVQISVRKVTVLPIALPRLSCHVLETSHNGTQCCYVFYRLFTTALVIASPF